jgi:hypothetical protein
MDAGSKAGMTIFLADNDAIVKITPLLSHKNKDRSSGELILLIIFAFFTGG